MFDRKQIANLIPGGHAWYSIQNLGQSVEVRIYDEISMWGTTAESLVAELDAITAPEIIVSINSKGGDVFDGIAIYNALRNHPAHITTRVDSLAASIASVIAQAGDTRQMVSHSQLMIHEAHGVMVGNASDMKDFSDLLEKQSSLIAAIYAERSGGTAAAFRKMMKDGSGTWLLDTEALAKGLTDEILEPAPRAAASPKIGNHADEPTPSPVDWNDVFASAFSDNQEYIT